jgi:hypothetical protein
MQPIIQDFSLELGFESSNNAKEKFTFALLQIFFDSTTPRTDLLLRIQFCPRYNNLLNNYTLDITFLLMRRGFTFLLSLTLKIIQPD